MNNLNFFLDASTKRVNHYLKDKIFKADSSDAHKSLEKAVQYSLFSGGKRIRPALVYATGEIFHNTHDNLDLMAAIVEMLHVASLILDDLPALDNDTLRRGKNSCHIEFDESTAILAGVYLSNKVFSSLTEYGEQYYDQAVLLQMLNTVTECFQVLLHGEHLDLHLPDNAHASTLQTLYEMKTSSMIHLSTQLAALASNIFDKNIQEHLRQYSSLIGICFQIHDDLLEINSPAAVIGKNNSDKERDNPTLPMLIGQQQAKELEKMLLAEALAHINSVPGDTALLLQLSEFMITRIK